MSDAGADAGHEIELQEIPRPPDPLELRAEHPQRQHVEQDVEDPAVQEHVGGELPHPELVQHERRHQAPGIGPPPCANDVTRNITTLAPINAFSAVEIGPGPKENEEA